MTTRKVTNLSKRLSLAQSDLVNFGLFPHFPPETNRVFYELILTDEKPYNFKGKFLMRTVQCH